MPKEPSVAAVVLAAGRSSRMGGPNKLLAELGGIPIVRLVVTAALASRAKPVIVVTGHQADAVRQALDGLDAVLCHNPDFADGLSTSLRVGIGAVPLAADAALLLLGDMPGVTAPLVDAVIAAFQPAKAEIVVATDRGQRGNPVLWSRRFFGELAAAWGDVGGRLVMKAHADVVREVEVGPAARLDLDTPEALAAAGARIVHSGVKPR
ncbi:MAG: nucleotidyltransferase family protein [Bauldia sp.]